MELAVCGNSAFTLGFALSGIRHIKTVQQDGTPQLKELMNNPEIGIILTDQQTMDGLPEFFRQTVESSVKPVIVVLSADAAAQEGLRRLIKKSIGVDLWV